jgi:crossover junction endodeoxyribonuclease RuvC
MRFAFVDPGLSGAIAVVDTESGEARVFDMPTTPANVSVLPPRPSNERAKSKKKSKVRKPVKRMVDPHALGDLLRTEQPSRVVVERVGAMPGQGVTSMFNFGKGFGTVLGVAGGLGIPVELVSPAVWKSGLGLIGTSKDRSREEAAKLYPSLAGSLVLKKHDGRAEALLIGRHFLLAQLGSGAAAQSVMVH